MGLSDEASETYMVKIPVEAFPQFTLEDMGVTPGTGLEFDGGGLLQVTNWTMLGTPVTVASSISLVTEQDIAFDLSAEATIPDDAFQLLFEVQGTHCKVTLDAYDGAIFHAIGVDAQTQKNWVEVVDLTTLLQQVTLDLHYEEVTTSPGTGTLDHIKILGYRY